MVREAVYEDLKEILELYLDLHEEEIPEESEHLESVWKQILSGFRGRGYATECLDYARNIAEQNNCYKMMLLTGAKDQKTLDFYKRAGYNSEDKTAFIQWIKP